MKKNTYKHQLENIIKNISGWQIIQGKNTITKTYVFKTFSNTFAWMMEIALKCEKMDHHPEWTNIYSKVIVNLTTHDAGEVTEKDIKLAEFMDATYEKYK